MERPCPILPDDIIEDIFTRLPARTALGCRGLSRAWAAALSSDVFVDRHRRAANRHGGPRFFHLRFTRTKSDKDITSTTAHAWSPASCPDDGIVPIPQISPPVCWMHDLITHSQQCRGLVVVDLQSRKFEVYNPSTGRRTALPPHHYVYTVGSHTPRERRYESLGIGYDASKRQHKVVRIYYRGDKLPQLCEVKVYVVDGEGFWRAPAASGRQPEARKPAGWVSSYEASVFTQGHVHWMAQKQMPKKDYHWRVTRRGLIVSFSVADEAFGVVPLPPHVDYFGDYRLTELEGRLCLSTPTVRQDRPYDVWLLRDHETGTWDLRCRIDLHTASPEVSRFMRSCVTPVAAMDDGRRILFMPSYESSSSYVSAMQPAICPSAYTPATGTMERFPSGGGLIAFANHTYDATREGLTSLYEESIISPGRPHEDVLFSSAAIHAMCVVLARHLPRRDLARFKLVCRSWRAMINSKRFFKLSAPVKP